MVRWPRRVGPVQVYFREDGTLSIYQPDHNHVLSADTAEQLIQFLAEGLGLTVTRKVTLAEIFPSQTLLVSTQPTVPDGVICTSEGPVTPAGLTDTEIEADLNAEEARTALSRQQATVPDGVITGTGTLTDTEIEADKNAAEAREALVETSVSTPDAKPPVVKRRPASERSSVPQQSGSARRAGRPRKTP